MSARVNTAIKPERCPSEATAAVPATPRVPDGAGFPMPLTDAERAAVGVYTPWLTALGADNAEKTRRLAAVKAWCDDRQK